MAKGVAALAGSAIVLAVGFASCNQDRQLAERALAVYVENRKAYAARVFEQVGVLPDVLSETSGLAVSRTQPGVLWSHNDSGGGPNLYAIDGSGRLLAIVPVTGAMARDWEDIASGPCPASLPATTPPADTAVTSDTSGRGPATCLYLADTGDNERVRQTVTVYVVREPRVAPGADPPPVPARSFSYRYPREPEDTEALAVTPDGDVTIVSKGRTGTIDFFGVPAASVSRALVTKDTITAAHQGNTGIEPDAQIGRHVTGAAVSPDGMTLAVRTYTEVFFYGAMTPRQDGQRWRDLERPCLLGTDEPQGEGIDYLDEGTLLVTSEAAPGRPAAIRRLQCN
jgi:hypothetical protein